ncbi:MAG: sigma-70 family RNA polymerase sigma factor [Candidatus Limnocylindria bacterium]
MRQLPEKSPQRVPDSDLADVLTAQADRAAFAVLYRRYLDPIYGYCFYLLGDHHDAEDATERTFLAAMSALDRFRDTGSTFRSWLFRIAHNELANMLRSRRRHRSASLDLVPELAAGDDPARLAGRAEDTRRLQRAVGRLGGDRRQVVVLRFVEGLSTSEIAEVLDRSDGAVRVLQHRALRDLAQLLAEDPRRT